MTSIKKILKKFDKNFYHIYGKVTMLYIYKKLELKHSDLLYILNLKIIDETSAIIENIMKDLKFFANKKGLKKIKSLVIKPSEKILNNEDFEKQHSQDQLIPNENDLDKSHNDIPNIFKDVELNIFRIDELYLSFRKSFKEWTYHLKNTNKTYNNGYSIVANTSVLGIPSSDKPYKSESSDDLYQKYIRSPATSDIISLKAHSIDSEFLFTSENMNNVILILAHSFLFMFSYSIVIPTNCVFLSDIGIEKFYSGLALGLTPLGTILSLFIAKYAANWSFKKPLILSIFLSFLSAGLYIFASILKSFTLIMVSRFILGVGSFRYLNRAYLKHFIGQKKISKYLLFYQLSSLIGLAAGPLFSIPLSLIGNTAAFQDDRLKNIFNFSTFPAWLLLLLNLLLILMFIVYFSEPLDTAFMAFRDGITFDVRSVSIDRDRLSYKDKNMIDDIDKKLSQINENNKFSDTNLVNKFLQEIAWKESNSNSYLYKCFSVFIILLIIVRITTETLLVLTPLYLVEIEFSSQEEKRKKDIEKILLPLISFLISISLFLIIPVGYFFQKKIINKVRERRIILFLSIICLIFNILIINFYFFNIYQYCAIFIAFMISTNLLENTTTTMFSNIIPSNYNVYGINAGFIVNISTSVGRTLGCCIITLLGNVDPKTLNIVSYSVTGVLMLIGIVALISLYPNLRVKAIARILRNRASIIQHKPAEF